MIKANEIRLGNIIQVGGSTLDTYQTYKPHVVTVDTIKAIKEENDERGNDYILSVFQPIPLTPEILEAAGFRSAIVDDESCLKLEMTNGIDKYGFIYFIENSCKAVSLFHRNAMIGTNIYYLHQLQNLFFTLTDEELTIDVNALTQNELGFLP